MNRLGRYPICGSISLEVILEDIRDLKRDRDRKRCEVIKNELDVYGANLRLIDYYKKAIKDKRDRINGIRSGLGNTDPSKGGGCCQEDTIVKVLDEVKDLELAIRETWEEISPIRQAIKSLTDPKAKAIVMRVWVDRTDSMRELAMEYGMSKDAVWRKSDASLLSLYKKLIK